jgi:hypothetical protein
MSIVKQLHVNKLGFCFDVTDIIKSYCFYDIITWETISLIRSFKNRLNELINNSCISRKNPHDFFDIEADNDEHWVFWIFDHTENATHFQSINCKICGNYKFTTNNDFPDNIRCNCFDENDNVPPLIDMETGIWVV